MTRRLRVLRVLLWVAQESEDHLNRKENRRVQDWKLCFYTSSSSSVVVVVVVII